MLGEEKGNGEEKGAHKRIAYLLILFNILVNVLLLKLDGNSWCYYLFCMYL